MLLKKLRYLEVLNLEKTELGLEGLKTLTKGIELVNLKILKIRIPLRKISYNCFKSLTCNSTKLELIQFEYSESKPYMEVMLIL